MKNKWLILSWMILLTYQSDLAVAAAAAVKPEIKSSFLPPTAIQESHLCQMNPDLPLCFPDNSTHTNRSDVPPQQLECPDRAFVTVALDYISTTQLQIKELRESESKLQEENKQLELRLVELEKHDDATGSSSSLGFPERTTIDTDKHNSASNICRRSASTLRPVDCSDHMLLGATESGVYLIYPFSCKCSTPVRVWCDMETDGGGWTVVLARQNSSHPVRFDRSWLDYRDGFGNASSEYWLGNEHLHVMTSSRQYTLRLDFHEKDGQIRWGEWPKFIVDDEPAKYKVSVPQFRSDSMINNCFANQNGKFFTTFDVDNDNQGSRNCAIHFSGAFWYSNCGIMNPTIPYDTKGHLNTDCQYVNGGKTINLQGPALQLKVRPQICCEAVKRVNFMHYNCQ